MRTYVLYTCIICTCTHVYVHVCVYIRMYIITCIYVYIYIDTATCTCTCKCSQTEAFTCMYENLDIQLYTIEVCVWTYTYAVNNLLSRQRASQLLLFVDCPLSKTELMWELLQLTDNTQFPLLLTLVLPRGTHAENPSGSR